MYLLVSRKQSSWRFFEINTILIKVSRRLCPIFVRELRNFAQHGRDTARGKFRGYRSSEEIGHCSHEGTGLLSAAAFSAAPILRTAAATEVARDRSDGGWGGAVDPQRKRDPFCNIAIILHGRDDFIGHGHFSAIFINLKLSDQAVF